MNQFDFFILNFARGNVTTQLRYRMQNNPVTHAWTSLMSAYHRAGFRVFPAEKIVANVSKARDPMNPFVKNASWSKIKDNIRRLNQKSHDFQDLRWVLTSRLNQAAFNRLHYQFHWKMEENHNYDSETNQLLSEINIQIHRIENIENAEANDLAMNYISCSMHDSHLHRQSILPEQRKFFCNPSVLSAPGDIYLSYATLGKHLYEAYSGQDIDLVREGGIRPQEYITCTFTVSANTRSGENLETHCQKVQQWLLDNQAAHLINPRLPEHYYHIEPLLAQLVVPRTEYELAGIFANFDSISFDLE